MAQFFSKPDLYCALCGSLRFRVHETRIEGVPTFMRGLRALFVTDVHVTCRASDHDLDAFVNTLKAIPTDIVFWGGDYSDAPEHAERLFERLSDIAPRLGSCAVLGNNDREAFADTGALRGRLARAGIGLLVNASEPIDVNGGRMIVAGIDEHFHGTPDARGLYPDSPSADVYRILLSHFPILPDAPLPDLMLSGHTHGGQFNALGLTPYSIGFERLFARCGMVGRGPEYISGLHRCGDARVLVGKGIGASKIPLRIGVRPEVELISFN